MSKQLEAKLAQCYVSKATPSVCGNCRHFRSKTEDIITGWGTRYKSEFALRCGLGGFAVKKMATCAMWTEETVPTPQA